MAHISLLPVSRPRLRDLKSCENWLEQVTLADSRHASSAYLALLDELEDAPPRHSVHLQILERLRLPILLAQEEHAKCFAGKPLPLGHAEKAAFIQGCDLLLALQHAYRRLWRAALKGESPELEPSIALLCHRVLACSAELIGTHFLARREVESDLWQWLHEAYAAAEVHGMTATPVADGRSESSCTAAYVTPLLVHLANPCGMPARELAWTRRWARHWAHKVRLDRDGPDQGSYAVNLGSDLGATWTGPGANSDSLRFLDLTAVLRSVNERLRRLEKGVEPAELGLGRECTQPAAGELLQALARAWFAAPVTRQLLHRAGAPQTGLVNGLVAIHHAIEGKAVARGTSQWDYSHRDAEQLHIFQRALDVAAKQRHEPELENWETLGESATELCLRRKEPGARVALRQLVAVRPYGGQQFVPCEVRWLVESANHVLTIGAQELPGLARACAVRLVSSDPMRTESFSPALMLSVAPGRPPSLVLPSGWYQRARMIEIKLEEEVRRIKLFGLLSRGLDFDFVNFTAE